jgi:hypothetical protein
LADRPLDIPHRRRLSPGHPRYETILAAHRQALASGEPGYRDPTSGLFVFSAAFLAQRGYCCQSGCRHCPYLAEA